MSTEIYKIYGHRDKYITDNGNRKGSFIICDTCKEKFYTPFCYIRRALKKGHNVRHCSLKCYIKLGEDNPFYGKTFSPESLKKLISNPNRPKFKTDNTNPNHKRYGKDSGYIGFSKAWWINRLLEDIGKCEMCGFSDKRALCMHHNDKDSNNNIRENLVLLCWNCHQIWHYNDRSGIYSNIKEDKNNRNVG